MKKCNDPVKAASAAKWAGPNKGKRNPDPSPSKPELKKFSGKKIHKEIDRQAKTPSKSIAKQKPKFGR